MTSFAQDVVLRCPSCESREHSLYRALSEPGGMPVLKCGNCGSIFRRNERNYFFEIPGNEPPRDKSLLESQELDFYTNAAFKRICINSSISILRRAMARLAPKTILDLGCGSGGYSLVLSGLYEFYYGLDPSEIPEKLKLPEAPPQNATLFRYDPAKPLPIHDEAVDMVAFIASYDHLPDPEKVMPDAWRKLKPGGFLLILMQNRGFWPKRFLNIFARGNWFLHKRVHYRAHTPDSLVEEIISILPDAALHYQDADYFFIPNIPKALSHLYFSENILLKTNAVLKLFFGKIIRIKSLGSAMIVVFRKKPLG